MRQKHSQNLKFKTLINSGKNYQKLEIKENFNFYKNKEENKQTKKKNYS